METSPDITYLDARLKTGRVLYCRVDLGNRQVTAASVALRDGIYAYLTDTLAANEPKDVAIIPASETNSQELWTVRVDKIRIDNNGFTYGRLTGTPRPGMDFDHLQVTNLNLVADSIFNRGTTVKAHIREFSVRERSGLAV